VSVRVIFDRAKKWLICPYGSTTTGLLGLGPVSIDSTKLALSLDTKISAQLGSGASPTWKRGLDRYQPSISPFGCRHSSPRQRWSLLSKGERENSWVLKSKQQHASCILTEDSSKTVPGLHDYYLYPNDPCGWWFAKRTARGLWMFLSSWGTESNPCKRKLDKSMLHFLKFFNWPESVSGLVNSAGYGCSHMWGRLIYHFPPDDDISWAMASSHNYG